MLQDIAPPHHYHSPPQSIPSPLIMDQHRQTPHPMMSLNNPSPIALNNASPLPLNNSSPMPLNNSSPLSLNNASPMPLNNASPMPLTSPQPNPNMPLTPPHSNENVPPDETLQRHMILDKILPEEDAIDPKQGLIGPSILPLIENNGVQHQMQQDQIHQQIGSYIPVYPPEVQMQPQREFEKAQEFKPRKVSNGSR